MGVQFHGMVPVTKLITTILVDDDIAMLRGLERIISWRDEGFEIVGQAENGHDALQLVHGQQVDLIICDITMPGMDGLELTREAKRILPGIKSIVLTCHEEFGFAKEAVAAQADDYLVKYTLTKDELLASLERVKVQIRAEYSSRSQVVRAQRAIEASRYSLLRRLTTDLLQDSLKTDFEARAADLGVQLPPANYVAIGLFKKEDDPEHRFALLEDSFSVLDEATLLPIDDSMDLLLYWGYHTKVQTARELESLFASALGRASLATIALADGFSGIHDIGRAIAALRELAESAFYMPYGCVLKDTISFSETEAWDLFAPIRGDLRTSLNTADQATAQLFLGKLFEEFERARPEPAGVRSVVESILIDIGFVANDARVPFHISFAWFVRLGGYRDQLFETVRAFSSVLSAACSHSPRNDIERAKAYIDNHLAEPIGLGTICELVFMNKSYLSRLFKLETGETFSEYLMRRRVEKAKRLLQFSEKTIDEITEAIGLENANHFYRIFKKVTGTTPGTFRK